MLLSESVESGVWTRGGGVQDFERESGEEALGYATALRVLGEAVHGTGLRACYRARVTKE